MVPSESSALRSGRSSVRRQARLRGGDAGQRAGQSTARGAGATAEDVGREEGPRAKPERARQGTGQEAQAGVLGRVFDQGSKHNVDRLIRVRHTRDDLPENFAHDPAGNLLMQDRPGPTQIKGNRLQMQGDRHYDYDAFGNLIRERRGRAQTLVTRRTVKKDWQIAWLLRAISCMDLTTLSGDDTDERVRRLCAKAKAPVRPDILAALGFAGRTVTTGANSTVRNKGLNRASRECSSSAAPSDAPSDSGTPTATK